MAMDREIFIENYLEELKENIHIINSGIIKLKKDPDNSDELNTVLRSLHTIKGSSRMLKFRVIEQISHGLESVFNGIEEGRYSISDNIVQLVFKSTEILEKGADIIFSKRDDETLDIDKLLIIYNKAFTNEPFDLEVLTEKTGNDEIEKDLYDDSSIRIKVNRIDQIIKSMNSLVLRPLKIKKENDALAQLERKLKDIYKENTNNHGIQDCLSTLQEIIKNLKNEQPLLERETIEIQEDLLKLRMLPLDLILKPLDKMIEEISINLGKNINTKIIGREILIDKFLLEKLKDPLIHLIRNSIDHGIESPQKRLSLGKTASGNLLIECSSGNGNVTISVKDDGKGVDYNLLRERIKKNDPDRIDEIDVMDKTELNSYLFQSGFSTKDKVSDLSGRGVGLDIVRTNIENIKGKITIDTTDNLGTSFILSLPHSLGYVDGFFITVANRKFLIPSNFVDEIILLKDSEKVNVLNRRIVEVDDKMIPVYYLSDLFDSDKEKSHEKEYIVIVESRGQKSGIVVDVVVEYSSLIYKQLPKGLKKVKGLQGVVFDENFQIVNILTIPEILNKLKRINNIDSKKRFSTENKEYKKILIVDDSLTTRNIEKSILSSENYRVDTAVDGIDGLNKTKNQFYNLIITDIEMPRMDGFTFVENLRKTEKYHDTPIIVISSKNSKEIKERFFQLGANSFIVKSDFERGNLLEEVQRYI